MAGHELADALPEQQQGVVVLLILDPDERSPEFKSRRQRANQGGAIVKQRSRIKAGDALGGDDAIRPSDAIGADDPGVSNIPRKQVEIARVEPIEVDRPPRTLADLAIRNLAEAANLLQCAGNARSLADEYSHGAAFDETGVCRQRGDFRFDEVGFLVA